MSGNEATDEPADISNLQETFNKQQKKISALKDLVRKSEVAHGKSTSKAQEKVRNIAQRLTQLKFKARARQSNADPLQKDDELQEESLPAYTNTTAATSSDEAVRSSNTGSEKFQLLRQQMQQNKALMEQRASSKQHLEQLVTQLKEKFDTTQQCLEDSTDIGKSMTDISVYGQTTITRERYKSATDLSTQSFSLEKERIKFLENRCRLLEKQLTTKKQQQADNSLQEALASAKQRVEELELQLQVAKTQTDSINELQMENERLLEQLNAKDKRIDNLEEALDVVETARFDLNAKISNSETLVEKLQAAYKQLQSQVQPVCVTAVLTPEQQNLETDEQVKAEMAKQIQELQDELRNLKAENEHLNENLNKSEKLEVSDISIAEKIADLEANIELQSLELTKAAETIAKQKEELMEKTIELNVLNANFKVLEENLELSSKNKPLFPQTADDTDHVALMAEIQQLKQKLDESNKAMIKLKVKCKQSEKHVEKLQKSSDLHVEIVTLQKSNEELQQKITELEDEKGQWQLTIMDESKASAIDDLELTEQNKTQAETIRLLEEQKYEQLQQLEDTKTELEKLQQQLEIQLQTDRVKTELSDIQWEERLTEQEDRIKQLQEALELRDNEIQQLQQHLKQLQSIKEELEKKAEHYVAENMELLDKVEKLSKSSSSAESIEIVERLTQLERAELAAYDKRLEAADSSELREHVRTAVNELTQTELSPDVSENLIKLREESSELMNKIELFTNERCEVLEKMESLTAENLELLQKIEQLNEQRDIMETNALLAENSKTRLEQQLLELSKEKDMLRAQVAENTMQRANTSQELTSLQKTSEVVAALDSQEGATLFDKCEKSLSKLNSELEAYRKAADKGAKFNASKKLAKEAKNAHTQLSELLSKVKEASNAVETVTVVETVVAVTAPNGKALAEYEQLNSQNRELKMRLNELELELEELRDTQNIIANETAPLTQESEAAQKDLLEARLELQSYVMQCNNLREQVDDLRLQLQRERLLTQDKIAEVNSWRTECAHLKDMSNDFDVLLNEKEMAFEQKMERLTLLRMELEGKCETYESEIEVLNTLVAEQKQQLIEVYKENEHEMNMKLLELQQRDEELKQLREELLNVHKTNQNTGTQTANDIAKECEKLKEALRINKALIAEQIDELSNKQDTIDSLNTQITELYKTMEENTLKIIAKEDKIIEMEQLLAENNKQLEILHKDNNEQKTVVDKLLNELHTHRDSLPNMQAELARIEAQRQQLEKANLDLEARNKEQVEKLKKYVANLKKRAAQCLEYETKIKDLEKGAIEQMQSKEHEQIVEENTKQLQELKVALQTKTVEVLEADEQAAKLQQQLQEAQLKLEKSLQETVQLQNALAATQMSDNQQQQQREQLAELEILQNENDQLRMELLLLREAERRERQASEELRAEVEKLQNMSQADSGLEKVRDELKTKALKFEKSKAMIKERNNQIQRLQQQILELQQQLSKQPEEEAQETTQSTVDSAEYAALKTAHELLQTQFATEQSNFQQTIERLETLHAGIEAKLQEDMSYIETLEQENNKYKDKVYKLEEAVAAYEERRASMERHASLLDAQMQTRADEFEKTEDELVYRLNMLSEHDEIIAQRLLKTHEQNETMQEQLQQLQDEIAKLNKQHAQQDKELQHYKTLSEEQQELKAECELRSEEALKRLRKEFESKLAEKQQELDDADNEQSEQLHELQTERRNMQEELERAKDENIQLKDDMVRLQEAQNALEQSKTELERESSWLRLQQENAQQDQYEMQELRIQSMQNITEIENFRHQIETLATNHEAELQSLRTQLSDIETLRRNQTDDQAFIESENKRLNDLLTEKQALIEHLQQQLNRDATANNNNPFATTSSNSHIIPAPVMFFSNETAMSSPFDEIVQMRDIRPLDAAHAATIANDATQSALNEVERNVSDLEKHEHELEHRLASNNQRAAEQEERVQDLQRQLQALQQQLLQRDEKIAELAAELRQQDVESQMLSNVEQVQAVAPSLDMFFGQQSAATDFERLIKSADESVDNIPQPVTEEFIVPKKAYVCQTAGAESASDDWGDSWAGNDQLLDETKHFTTTTAVLGGSLLPREQQLNLQLQEAQERVHVLELALERSEAQKQELQLKSGKMMKKLKEYKTKLDNQSNRQSDVASAGFFDDLDVAIQDELKLQIQKLETRLAEQQKTQNTLSNEKEKLLQRLDMLEAGNERMAELKERQDTDVEMYQTRIRELQHKLDSLQDWTPQQTVQLEQHQPTANNLQLEQLTEELQDSQVERQELQALLEEERANLQRVEQMLKSLQETREQENLAQTEHNAVQLQYQKLQQQYNELSEQHTKQQYHVAELTAQLNTQELQLAELQSELLDLREKQAELMQTNTELRRELDGKEQAEANTELMLQLTEKNAEIDHLKQQIENLMHEDQTEKLVIEILGKNQEIHLLKLKVKDLEDDKHELEHNLSLQLTQEMQAAKEQELQTEQQLVLELQQQVATLEQDKQHMEAELQLLNNHVMESLQLEQKMKQTVLEMDVKNIEIAELRNSLAALKSQEPNQIINESALNAQWEAVLEQRCAEIAQMWRAHLEQRENEFKALEIQLQTQIDALRTEGVNDEQQTQTRAARLQPQLRGISTETTGTSTPASDSSSEPASETSSAAASKDNSPLHRQVIREADDSIIEKMQRALESQEMEIVTLKEQLAIRSAEYARLAAQYDPFNSSNTPARAARSAVTGTDGNAALVPKSELDLALYMLHQRDMRCEEMTHELVQLLEERDTLQIKLSNTLRQVESMKTQGAQSPATDNRNVTSVLSQESIADTSLTSGSSGDTSDELNQKLSQLQSVSHTKDRVIKEEHVQRIRQMEKIQQDVAKMPTAAVAELIGADLSQTEESPSSLLLNWLWGNKSPTTTGSAPNS